MEKNILSRRHFLLAGGAGLTLLRGATQTARPTFEEVLPTASGIAWVHDNAASPEHYLPETMGPGCAFLDYDNDGWMDIYLVNSGPCDFFTASRAHPQRALQEQSRRHVHRRHRKGRAWRAAPSAWAWPWAITTTTASPTCSSPRTGAPILYRNNGDGTFTDVSEKAGLGAKLLEGLDHQRRLVRLRQRRPARSVRLQLRGLRPTRATSRAATTSWGGSYYCIPRVFKPTASLLYHNNGDGTFTEVSRGTDIENALGKGLGVVATDINNDGRMDLFVANDTVQNFLFVNRGPRQTVGGDRAGRRGRLQRRTASARSGMGVDAADFDGDGWQDLFVANVDQEMFSLYRNTRQRDFSRRGAQRTAWRRPRAC